RVHLARPRPLGRPAGRRVRRLATRRADDKAVIEAFERRLRAQCLGEPWFPSLAYAREKPEARRKLSNAERPQGAVGYEVAIALTAGDDDTGPPPL
ncbi:MAG: integrase core domain-containing protein, partial [Pseudomonadota bacterium]